jgi:phage tail-like protein
MTTAYTQRTDPLRNFKFRVQILPLSPELDTFTNGIDDIGFAQVSGLAVSNEVITYREGGMNTHPHKFVGQSDFTPVAFARGAFAAQAQLWNWQKFMHAWVGGGVTGMTGGNKGSNYRCNILVKVYDHPYNASGAVAGSVPSTAPTTGAPTTSAPTLRYAADGGVVEGQGTTIVPGAVKLQYKLYNCWPGSYSLSDLSAGDTTGIMVQTMNVHHEGFYIDWTGTEDLSSK